MRITMPAAQLAAQSASTCSAYKRARSIWQCVVKFFGSASGTRGGGVGGVGVACRRAKEAAKKFCVVANFSAYFAHKTEAAFHFPPSSFSSATSSAASSSCSSAYFLHVSLRFGFHFSFRFLVSFLLNALIAIYQIGK